MFFVVQVLLALNLQATLIYLQLGGILPNLDLIDCNLQNESAKHFGSELIKN